MKENKMKEMLARKDKLTGKEKEKLARAILKNPKTRDEAMIGAFLNGNYVLAAVISICK